MDVILKTKKIQVFLRIFIDNLFNLIFVINGKYKTINFVTEIKLTNNDKKNKQNEFYDD